MSDLFHERAPDAWIDRIVREIALHQQHTFVVLTKRAERALNYLRRFVERAGHILHNLWLGVSVEDRARLRRMELLCETRAAVRFVSAEPLLGDLGSLALRGIDWVICGGESGPRARPMHPNWARSIRDQCAAAGVPFFFKQWGEWLPRDQLGDLDCSLHFDGHAWTADHVRAGKKAAGRLLDGREWSQYPAAGCEGGGA